MIIVIFYLSFICYLNHFEIQTVSADQYGRRYAARRRTETKRNGCHWSKQNWKTNPRRIYRHIEWNSFIATDALIF